MIDSSRPDLGAAVRESEKFAHWPHSQQLDAFQISRHFFPFVNDLKLIAGILNKLVVRWRFEKFRVNCLSGGLWKIGNFI